MDGETADPTIPPLTPPTTRQIDAMLVHLPHLEAVARGDFEPGSATRWGADSVLSERTRAFFHALYDLGVIQSFAWMEWKRGQELAESEGQLAGASLEDTLAGVRTEEVQMPRCAWSSLKA